jgi:hypothetical protein
MYETRVSLMNRKLLPPLNPQRVTGCPMSVTSRTTMPWTPRRVTNASWWPDGICDAQTTAIGAGGAGPPGDGLGNGTGDELGIGVAPADGGGLEVDGLLPHAAATRISTTRRRFMAPAILTPSATF